MWRKVKVIARRRLRTSLDEIPPKRIVPTKRWISYMFYLFNYRSIVVSFIRVHHLNWTVLNGMWFSVRLANSQWIPVSQSWFRVFHFNVTGKKERRNCIYSMGWEIFAKSTQPWLHCWPHESQRIAAQFIRLLEMNLGMKICRMKILQLPSQVCKGFHILVNLRNMIAKVKVISFKVSFQAGPEDYKWIPSIQHQFKGMLSQQEKYFQMLVRRRKKKPLGMRVWPLKLEILLVEKASRLKGFGSHGNLSW